jgi:replicative superfamily II helicase
MKKVIYIVLAVLVIVGGGGYLLAKEANAAAPGDALYPLDTAIESLQRVLVLDEVKLAEFEQDVLGERVEELDAVAEENITECLEGIEAQQNRINERLGEVSDQAELERIQNRYEEQVQEHTAVMEQVQEKVQVQENKVEIDNAKSGMTQKYQEAVGSNGTSGGSGNGNGNN